MSTFNYLSRWPYAKMMAYRSISDSWPPFTDATLIPEGLNVFTAYCHLSLFWIDGAKVMKTEYSTNKLVYLYCWGASHFIQRWWKPNTAQTNSFICIDSVELKVVEVHLTLSNGKDYILYHQNRGWMLTVSVRTYSVIHRLSYTR